MPPENCFPNRLESVPALPAAMRLNAADPRAPYYLGNFWYAHRRYGEAVECWERARGLGDATEAQQPLGEVLALDVNHQGAVIHRALQQYQQANGVLP